MTAQPFGPDVRRPGPGVLLPAADRAAERQRADRCGLSRYLPPTADVPAGARKRAVATLTLADLDAPAVAGFLDHLERQRRNSVRTRNARFAAIRSFLKYVSARDPASLPMIQRVLAIPMKRCERHALSYLSREEVDAILEAPDASTWSGQRDRMLFALLYNTGARVSEVIGLRRLDVAQAPRGTSSSRARGGSSAWCPCGRARPGV